MCVSVVCVDRTRPRRRVYVRTVSQYGERTDRARTFWKTYTVGDGTNRMHGCFVVECMESLCVYIVVHAHRARECMHARASNGCDGIDACIRLSSTREETDARDARTATIDIDRIERLSPSRLSRVSIDRLDRRIHRISSIHSFRCDRRDGRAKERRNDATDEGRRDRRETRDPRRETRPFASRAEREVRASRTHDASNRAFIACVHFKPPTGDDRARIAMNAMKRAKRSSD